MSRAFGGGARERPIARSSVWPVGTARRATRNWPCPRPADRSAASHGGRRPELTAEEKRGLGSPCPKRRAVSRGVGAHPQRRSGSGRASSLIGAFLEWGRGPGKRRVAGRQPRARAFTAACKIRRAIVFLHLSRRFDSVSKRPGAIGGPSCPEHVARRFWKGSPNSSKAVLATSAAQRPRVRATSGSNQRIGSGSASYPGSSWVWTRATPAARTTQLARAPW